jgi:hypothetical protein
MDACEKCEFYVKKIILDTKMCNEIYDHGQCVICITLKFQMMPHFLHNLQGLVVCSCLDV